MRYTASKYEWPYLEFDFSRSLKVKSNSAVGLPIYDFLLMSNMSSSHRLGFIATRKLFSCLLSLDQNFNRKLFGVKGFLGLWSTPLHDFKMKQWTPLGQRKSPPGHKFSKVIAKLHRIRYMHTYRFSVRYIRDLELDRSISSNLWW